MKLTIMAIVTALVVSLAAFTTMAQTATPTPEPTVVEMPVPTPTSTAIPNPCDPVVKHPGPHPGLFGPGLPMPGVPSRPYVAELRFYDRCTEGENCFAGHQFNQERYDAAKAVWDQEVVEWKAEKQAENDQYNIAFEDYINYIIACKRQ